MNRKEIKKFIKAFLNQVDRDIADSYDPKYAEEPDYAKQQMEKLTDFVENYLKGTSHEV